MISTQKVFLVHGYKTTPNGAWFPWLMGELKKRALFAYALDMPTPEFPVRDEWIQEIACAVDRHEGSERYLVGHSLGVAAILDYLQSDQAQPVRGAVLVSGRIEPSPALRTAGFYQTFEYQRIRSNCERFAVIHAVDDDMVPIENGVTLAGALGVDLTTLPAGKHLTGSQGVFELPEVLAALESFGVHSERSTDAY
ncbi:alpha/beta hydrolase [Patescibacteria group bacterium]|nr:alpha/beta hydrolase [Patescibacteria group bacterium]